MKKLLTVIPMKKLLLMAGMGMAMVGNAYAAEGSATSSGTVIVPITISKSVDLVFGSFAAGTAGGTIKVDTDNVISVTGGPTGVIKATGSIGTAAKFDIAGGVSNTYSIAHSGAAVLTNTTGETMALAKVSALTAASNTTTEVTSGTLSEAGTESVYVGGTLTVAANQVAGDYTGSVIVTVEYN